VTAILRVMGQSQEQQFQNYHRVLNRARWSSRALSRILLHLLVRAFVPSDAPIVVGIAETIERRGGAKIAAKGIYRDPVRSSKEFCVKTSGLRWVSMLLLAPIPWARRVWALPFLSVLAPSERYYEQRGRRHKKITDWGRQLIRQLRRWLADPTTNWEVLTLAWYGGQQRLVEVASGTAIWYHNGLPPVPIRWVLLRDPLSHFSPQALLCTDQAISPTQIIEWFVLRWQVELTFHEVRTHLGVETQRQWSESSDLAYNTSALRTLLPDNTIRSDLA
jgi:DDE superfamily endonuclease